MKERNFTQSTNLSKWLGTVKLTISVKKSIIMWLIIAICRDLGKDLLLLSAKNIISLGKIKS